MKSTLRVGVSLLAVATILGDLCVSTPAAAQDAATMEAIQRQISQLQAQLKKLQVDAARRNEELNQARQDAARARQDAQAAQKAVTAAPPALPAPIAAIPPGSLIVTQPPNDKDATGNPIQNPDKPNGKINVGGLTITLGGYFDLTGYDRSRNENRGTSTSFNGIPFQGPTTQGDATEFNMTGQQTRISVRADGKIDDNSSITGYLETDFNNGAGGANSVSSNSYTPRLRQAFADYVNNSWQFYALAGQAWSLATPYKKGLDPFQSFQPPTIDSNYLVGYDYLRVPALRVVKGFGPAWFGLELDAPQTVFGGNPPTLTNATLGTTFPGNGGLNPQANYSVNGVPDLIGKGAIDTDYGHYEAFGLLRQFQDQVAYSLNGATNTVGKNTNFNSTGYGVGGALFIPIMKYADIQGNILSGSGIGRYGAGGLSDVTFGQRGQPVPLRETMADIGVVGHVLPSVDVYAFGGIDQIGKSFFGSSGGYGNFGANNAGCFNPNAGSGCTGNNAKLSELTAGYYWKFLKGSWGTWQTGLQYAYVTRQAYGAKGGAPTGIENMVFFNFRYLPFQ